MGKKNILFCSPRFATGGIARWTEYILNFANGDSESVSLKWYYPNVKGCTTSKYSLSRLTRGVRSYLPFVMHLSKNLRGMDVAHLSTSANISAIRDFIVAGICRRRGVKTVLHLHCGSTPRQLKGTGLIDWIFRKSLDRSDMIVAMDSKTLEALKAAGYDNCCYLPNPLSPDVVELVEKTGEIERENRKVLFVGHVLDTKGARELVEACNGIENCSLEFMGECTEEMKRELRGIASDDLNAKMTFRGNLPMEEVIKGMKQCSVFALPSYSEGFPNVIIESMACGAPIVATDVGAIAEMLDVNSQQPCGVCVPPHDSEQLRMAIARLLDYRQEAEAMGERARTRVNEVYAMPVVWKRLKEIWETV